MLPPSNLGMIIYPQGFSWYGVTNAVPMLNDYTIVLN